MYGRDNSEAASSVKSPYALRVYFPCAVADGGVLLGGFPSIGWTVLVRDRVGKLLLLPAPTIFGGLGGVLRLPEFRPRRERRKIGSGRFSFSIPPILSPGSLSRPPSSASTF